ncbi:MAG: hypothetical protein LCH61_05155 [Proteobacteria bacterium]|nr:hypothetical protein [Pseudomonadota bacterium]
MLRIVILGLLVGLAALVGLFTHRIVVENRPITGTAQYYVGGHKLQIERAMVRSAELRDGGAVNRLDLVLQWPTLAGAASQMGTADPANLIFMSLEDATSRQRSPDDIDPAERPVELYARFLESDAAPGPGGLVWRKFRKATPFEGEQLFVSSPDERQFSARCPAEGTKTQDVCLWQTRLDAMDVVVRFQPRHLAEWRHLASTVRLLVPKFRAGK